MAPSARLTVLAVLLVTACGAPRSAPAVSPVVPRPVLASPTPAVSGPHVFVIVMENRAYEEAMAQPYTADLARRFAVATNYHAVSHPSLPNYLALTSGSTYDITDDGYHRLAAGGIGAQLNEHGIVWRAYMEGMTNGCMDSPGPYALKHNPFAYYGGACPANVVPLTELDSDLGGATPNFVWITPDLCHDGHDCSSRQADDFLSSLVPKVLAAPAWRQNGLLLITWDEDDGRGGNRVPALVVAPNLIQHQTARAYDHYSLLATVEDRLGLPRLGRARSATPLSELLG
jgi:acid phosphatase